MLLYGKAAWMDPETEGVICITIGHWVDYLYDESENCWVSETQNPYKDELIPTHWMPMPQPPIQSEGEGQ